MPIIQTSNTNRMEDFNLFYNDDENEYSDEYFNELIPAKNKLALSNFLFETQFTEEIQINKVVETEDEVYIDASEGTVEKRRHSMRVYRLDGTSIYRVCINYNMQMPYDMDLVKDPELGWVVEGFNL